MTTGAVWALRLPRFDELSQRVPSIALELLRAAGAVMTVRMRANLARTCSRCHTGATESFPSAWLSHYEPSWRKAPLVYGVKQFYRVLIPFMIGGLVLQVLLHLWRVVVNR